MFSTFPLLLTFLLHLLLLHPALAADVANAANVHVADILVVNEILEIQINHTIADVNAVVALNKTVIAPVVAADLTTIAHLLEVGCNAILATPPLTTKQAVTIFNSFVTDYAHAIQFLLATDSALDQPVVDSEQPVINELFGLLVAYGGFF